MADIAVVAAEVGMVDPLKAKTRQMIAAETITAGQTIYQNSDGKAALCDGGAAGTAQFRGIAMNGAGAGQAVTVLWEGEVEGFTITSLAYDARVYASTTAGALADAAAAVAVTCGRVVSKSDKDLTKVLQIFVDWIAEYS